MINEEIQDNTSVGEHETIEDKTSVGEREEVEDRDSHTENEESDNSNYEDSSDETYVQETDTMEANTMAIITKARKASGSLYTMTNRRSKLSMPNKLFAVLRNNPADINLRSTDMGLYRGPSDKANTDCAEHSTAQSNRRAMVQRFYKAIPTHPNSSIAMSGDDYAEEAPTKYKRPKHILAA
ncbi:hypothetical protein CBL_05051 [Carabus blaptoides fortunei]